MNDENNQESAIIAAAEEEAQGEVDEEDDKLGDLHYGDVSLPPEIFLNGRSKSG